MNRKIYSLAPLILAAGMLAVVFVLLAAFASAPASVQAGDINLRCDFLSITVTAAGLGVTPGVSDTLPGSNADRVVYFANHQTGTITLTVVLTDLHPEGDPCYLWAAPAWGIPDIRGYTATQGASTVVIIYSVAPDQTSATVVLTSSQYITGSLYATYSQGKILTFTRDITGPVVSNHSITTTAPHLWPVGTTLYYTNTGESAEAFWLNGESQDHDVGLQRTSFTPVTLCEGFSPPGPQFGQRWSARYWLCGLPASGVLTATSYDYVGNFTLVVFEYTIDKDPPSSTVTTTVQVSYGKAPIPLQWSAEDRGSGVKEVKIYARSGPSWGTPITTTSMPSGTFSFIPPTVYLTGPITYEFASAAVDRLGNTEPLPLGADAHVVVHPARLYLPLVLRNWVWWYQYDPYEPNDTPPGYGPLTSGQVITAYIWDSTDRDDYYWFQPSSNSMASISLTNIPSNCDFDLYVYIYSAGGYQLVARSNKTGNVDESASFSVTAGTKYYIRVYPYRGSSSQQPYQLTVRW